MKPCVACLHHSNRNIWLQVSRCNLVLILTLTTALTPFKRKITKGAIKPRLLKVRVEELSVLGCHFIDLYAQGYSLSPQFEIMR